MPAYGYEFYLLVFNLISHSFAALTREISSWPLEDKIHITRGHVISSIYLVVFVPFAWLTASMIFQIKIEFYQLLSVTDVFCLGEICEILIRKYGFSILQRKLSSSVFNDIASPTDINTC